MVIAATIPGLALLLIALSFAEVMWRRATGRALVPWMRGDGRPVSAVGFEQFDAVFNSARHLELDQRRTTSLLREDESAGAPGPVRVDLGSGKVTIAPAEVRD
ncbi:hypothetical protein IU433_27730 [Nocardia puris]|uniref:Uncharacterized protein n=1 Tax=Nocardia puris TaxID=208602 RepID=A0A366E3D7_9NOCA|nr:DUF6191 domain-containing protein [Nocardia puris]MBF6214433.1 hypothetical protein [Nocardia puris]MBF6369048.1 hypothetical protein [Nocardia puris]MBF6462804.1 hypothetical protein [Nocardia puris]RBO96817.1 hypothetical protein DFR74_101834 [Nocardia puris]